MMPGRPEPPAGDLARRRPVLVGLLLMVVAVGLPLAFRSVDPDLDLFPSGAGLVPYVLGIVVAALVAVVAVYGARHPVRQVSLPRAVRSAVRWRDTVPPEYRDRVPGWLAWQRRLCAQLAVQVVWTAGILLQADTLGGGGGATGQLGGFAIFLAVLLLPVGIYSGFVERARRHVDASADATP